MTDNLLDYFQSQLTPISARLAELGRVAEYVANPQDRRIDGERPPAGFNWECLIPWGSGKAANRLARKYPHWRGEWRRHWGKTYQCRTLYFNSKIAAQAFLVEMYDAGANAQRNWVEY